MLFFGTIGLFLLNRKIKTRESELESLRSIQPGDKNYPSAQQLIPFVVTDLEGLRKDRNQRMGIKT